MTIAQAMTPAHDHRHHSTRLGLVPLASLLPSGIERHGKDDARDFGMSKSTIA
jgi:hypothetical protein